MSTADTTPELGRTEKTGAGLATYVDERLGTNRWLRRNLKEAADKAAPGSAPHPSSMEQRA